MIKRLLEDNILQYIDQGKALIIIGPRQVGKTTLLKLLEKRLGRKTLFLNCDEIEVKNSLTTHSLNRLRDIIEDYEVVIIDEAQRIRDVGITLKLIIDNFKGLQLIVSGSSSLELANKINEPLTGRKFEFFIYPFSSAELRSENGTFEESKNLYKRLIFGSYPDVVNNPGKERLILNNLASSYLYRDIMAYQEIRRPELLDDLLKALALKLGYQVSYNELSRTVGTDKETVRRYIDLLEKAFIVFRLRSFSRNLRTELKKSRKLYFYDNGIRNAIVGNFNNTDSRDDTAALWENYLVSERRKYLEYNNLYAHSYFWRTTQQQEIDYIEEADGKICLYEFKWNPNKKVLFPKTFLRNYEVDSYQVINPDNHMNFI